MRGLEVIDSKKAQVADLCQKFGVTRLYVFGSALSEDWDPQRSDLDFLAEYGPTSRQLDPLDRLVGLQMALEEVFGRPVDVVDLNAAKNMIFVESSKRQAQEIYAA